MFSSQREVFPSICRLICTFTKLFMSLNTTHGAELDVCRSSGKKLVNRNKLYIWVNSSLICRYETVSPQSPFCGCCGAFHHISWSSSADTQLSLKCACSDPQCFFSYFLFPSLQTNEDCVMWSKAPEQRFNGAWSKIIFNYEVRCSSVFKWNRFVCIFIFSNDLLTVSVIKLALLLVSLVLLGVSNALQTLLCAHVKQPLY